MLPVWHQFFHHHFVGCVDAAPANAVVGSRFAGQTFATFFRFLTSPHSVHSDDAGTVVGLNQIVTVAAVVLRVLHELHREFACWGNSVTTLDFVAYTTAS